MPHARAAKCGSFFNPTSLSLRALPRRRQQAQWRCLHASAPTVASKSTPPFGFAFDIDGVLLRGSNPIPRAAKTLRLLRKNNIPFILVTNGGGKLESERVADLRRFLDLEGVLREECLVQSHSPFSNFVRGTRQIQPLQDKNVLVVGGEGDQCRKVAESYGFGKVVIPSDFYHAHPAIWPFSGPFADYHAKHARALPKPIYQGEPTPLNIDSVLDPYLRIHAVFVFNDPRDWGLDISVLMDLLLSYKGYLGTLSPRNGKEGWANNGWQQHEQPVLWFSNSDFWWAAEWPSSRLGQGAFRSALSGVWKSNTGTELVRELAGKPLQITFEYASKVLQKERKHLLGENVEAPKRVYMIGDNEHSDIRGANMFDAPPPTVWKGILVRTGIYKEGELRNKPAAIVDDVWDAVQWALAKEKWGADNK